MTLQSCALNLNRAGKELQPHGTVDFPCAGYSALYTDTADNVIPWHWHEEMEILYVNSGSLKLQIPGKTFRLTQGEGFVVNANVLHFAAADPVCLLQSFVFAPLMVTGGQETVFARKYITPLVDCCVFDGCRLDSGTGEQSGADDFVTAFEAISQGLPGYEFVVRDRLSQICHSLYRHFEREIGGGEVAANQDHIRIRKMLDFIHGYYPENVKLAEIARAADIGERECLRCFQRVIHGSPMQYLLKYRVMRGAAMLLEHPGSSIAEVSARCGFESPSNFSHMFKRFFICTPREYRNSNQRR